MKIDLVFLIVISIVIAYLFVLYKVDCNSDKIEKMADIGTVDQIKDAVRQVYQADVEAIRNLSNVATQLQAGGITVPGQLKVGGKLSTNNLDPSNMPDGWGGGLRIFDGYASGTMGFGPDGKKLNAYINSGGAIVGIDATIANNLTSTNLTSTNINGININASNKTNEGGSISIKNELKNGKANQTNSWTIWNMTGDYGNKLSFWRYNGDGVNAGPALDLFDNGTVNVPGNLKVGTSLCIGGTCIDESHLQMLTGARGVALKHTSGSWENHMDLPFLHVDADAKLVKWTDPANFALIKN